MKSYSPEPLTPEERELAKLTAHLGPQGEPSPALDARILSAAHAALERKQPRRKPRWPVAMGLAASVIFAVGIAWQLRPLQQAPVLVSAQAPVDETVQAQVMVDSPPGLASPAAEPAEEMAAADAAAPVQARVEQAPPAPAKALAAPAVGSRETLARQQAARAKTRASDGARQERMTGNMATASVPPPPAPPAPVSMAPAIQAEPAAPAAFTPDPRERETQNDAYMRRSVAADSSMAGAGMVSARPQAEASAEAKAARPSTATHAKENTTLDRVEVSGSRMKRTDLQVPVSDDAALPVNEWLERVRTRYGLGDAGAAKQSLLLFVKDHPSEPVPGDLEPLLEE